MHDTALISGSLFGKVYGKEGLKVLDVGGLNVNGSLRTAFEKILNMTYICMDIESHPSVDIVIKPGDDFPFEDGTFDLIVSTSCFEHDPCFWMTFREMCRVIKKNGFIYMNAPSNGPYHGYPGDNWRFYSDAGQALAYWSGKELNGKLYPVKVEESFHILPKNDIWIDYVTVWKRVDTIESDIKLPNSIRHTIGPLHNALKSVNYNTQSIIYNQ